jgi:hypothetical protein
MGMGAFGAACLLGLLALKRGPAKNQLLPVAAYVAFVFFILLTEMHENYLHPAVTLLVLACWQSRPLRLLAFAITITSLVNVMLHDPPLIAAWPAFAGTFARLRLANSAVNVALFAAWTAWLMRQAIAGRGGPRQALAGGAQP